MDWALWILLAVVMGILAWVGWRLVGRYFIRQYFRKHYAPIALEPASIGSFPLSYHLQDVPWCCTREAYCEANTLQMIAHQSGKAASRDEVNFLMGFTYGGSAMPGRVGFTPCADPEPGHAVAAPYLGLVRHYYVSDHAQDYLRALRFHLSQGHPLHVPLDYGVLYERKEFIPHSNLLVGYDPTGFYYYETVALEGISLEPGLHAPGEQGWWVPDEKLLEAVASQSRHFRLPWRYAFALFEPWPAQSDLKPIWRRNARLLMGSEKYGPKQGAAAIEQTARQIQKRWRTLKPTQLERFLQAAVYTRHDNADFLRARFGGDESLMRAANLLEQAGQNYQWVWQAVQKGIRSHTEANQVAAWLNEAATAEWEVGSIFARVATAAVQPALETGSISESTQPGGGERKSSS
ncbi:MAG: hypothetical protein N2318_06525 [Meiothermus sp.]|nr:hypothetical protein [Meiothermus sp.]